MQSIKKIPKKILSIIIILILIIGGVIYAKNRTPSPERAQKMQMAENKKTMEAIKALMDAPAEEPIIATINDAAVLVKEQAFYNGSQNGDKLVIFPNSQKAIIYSKKRNKIVNSGPFTINGATAPIPNK